MTANPQASHNGIPASAPRTSVMLPTPGFHHIHLNSPNPDAAIDWYMRQFPSTSKGEWGGHPALRSPNNVMVLFSKTDKPAPSAAKRDLAVRLARHRCAPMPRN